MNTHYEPFLIVAEKKYHLATLYGWEEEEGSKTADFWFVHKGEVPFTFARKMVYELSAEYHNRFPTSHKKLRLIIQFQQKDSYCAHESEFVVLSAQYKEEKLIYIFKKGQSAERWGLKETMDEASDWLINEAWNNLNPQKLQLLYPHRSIIRGWLK